MPVRPSSTINQTEVTSAGSDPQLENNVRVTFTTVGEEATEGSDLVLMVNDTPDPVQAGNILSYTMTISNAGTSTASGIVVQTTLSQDVTFEAATTDQGTCSLSDVASVVLCELNTTLNMSNTAMISLSVRVEPGTTGTIISQAEATANETDPDPDNNRRVIFTTVADPTYQTEADLEITVNDTPDPVDPGASLTYALTLSNNGPDSVSSAVLQSTLPTHVTLDTVTVSQGRYSLVGDAVVWTLTEAMANGATATAEINVTVNTEASGTLTSEAEVTSEASDPQPENNTSTTETTITGTLVVDGDGGLYLPTILR